MPARGDGVPHPLPLAGQRPRVVTGRESAFVQAVYSPVLFTQHLPVHIRTAHARAHVRRQETVTAPIPATTDPLLAWREAKDAFEREYTRRPLGHSEGNIMEAGRLSGLSRTRLYQLIKKYTDA